MTSSRTHSTLVSCNILLMAWFYWIVWKPLSLQAIQMAHLDPTEIVAIPFELQNLLLYVVGQFLLVVLIVTRHFKPRTAMLTDIIKSSVMIHGIMFLCGAPPWNLASVLASVHVATALSCWHHVTTSNSTSNNHMLEHLFQPLKSNFQTSISLYGMLLGFMVCQILHILDWGVQLQRYPLPILFGMLVGFAIASILRIMVVVTQIGMNR